MIVIGRLLEDIVEDTARSADHDRYEMFVCLTDRWELSTASRVSECVFDVCDCRIR